MTGDRSLALPEGLDGERLDAALARLFGLSRSRVVALIDAGAVHVDGAVASKSQRVAAGQWLDLQWPQDTPASDGVPAGRAVSEPADSPQICVLHADDDIIVIDKPVGVAAHPSPGWTGPTVVGQVAQAGYRISTSGAAERQGIVHRLDVGTSGVMVVAASERAYGDLKDQFRQRAVEKIYHALVQGHPDPSSGTIDAPIDRHPSADYRFAVVTGGKPSITHYDTIEAFRHASLLDVHLETGRTHQIRVHMAAMRHPCVGDLTYGADPVLAERLGLRRQWLHALSLTLDHPGTGVRTTFTSDYPDDLAAALSLISEWSQ